MFLFLNPQLTNSLIIILCNELWGLPIIRLIGFDVMSYVIPLQTCIGLWNYDKPPYKCDKRRGYELTILCTQLQTLSNSIRIIIRLKAVKVGR